MRPEQRAGRRASTEPGRCKFDPAVVLPFRGVAPDRAHRCERQISYARPVETTSEIFRARVRSENEGRRRGTRYRSPRSLGGRVRVLRSHPILTLTPVGASSRAAGASWRCALGPSRLGGCGCSRQAARTRRRSRGGFGCRGRSGGAITPRRRAHACLGPCGARTRRPSRCRSRRREHGGWGGRAH